MPPQDTIKNKEDFHDLINQCDWIRQLIGKSTWSVPEKGAEISSVLLEALTELSGLVLS